MTIRGLVFSSLFFLVGLGLILYSGQLSNWFLEKPAKPLKTLGTASADVTGGYFKRKKNEPNTTSEFQRIKKGDLAIYHGDEFRLPRGMSLKLHLNNYSLLVHGAAQWNIEQWDPNLEKSPIYITMVDGQIQVLQVGDSGQVYIVRDGRIFAPELQPAENEPRKIVISNESEKATAVEEESKEEAISDEVQTPTAAPSKNILGAKMPEKLSQETLSNEEITQTLTEKAHLFRRCQINNLRDTKNAEGSILVSMTIEPSGRVSQIQLLQNETQNAEMGECVQSVINRTQFRAFTGIPITVSYPLEFR